MTLEQFADPTIDPSTYYLLDPFLEWRKSEGIRTHEGFGFDCLTLDLDPWPRLGGKGAYVDVLGRGDFASMYVAEIAPGGQLAPERHIHEEIIYVLKGRGSTTLDLPGFGRRSFEWHEGSLFGIPVNAGHQHFNASGTDPARFAAVTNLPILMNVFHNADFIFKNDFAFTDRVGDGKYLNGEGDYRPVKPGRNQWQTLLVPDLPSMELPDFAARGAEGKHLHFVLSEASMHAHMAELPAARYKKAHRHPAGAHIFTVTGRGYTTLWLEGKSAADSIRFDWQTGSVEAPPEQYLHQHFNTGNEAARYMAVSFGSVRYPITAAGRHMYENLDVPTKSGGTQIDYEDEDPQVYDSFLAELAKTGTVPRMERPNYRAGALTRA
jgi:quercetin dioxygenase-like cupin family protein